MVKRPINVKIVTGLKKIPKCYTGFIDSKGKRIGEQDLWADAIQLTAGWDSLIKEIYKDWVPKETDLLVERAYSYAREREKARREKKILKNPATGETGWWITVKGGKKVFVSAEKAAQQQTDTVRDYAETALKGLGLTLAAATGLYGLRLSMNSLTTVLMYSKGLTVRRALGALWRKKDLVADQLKFIPAAMRRAGIIAIPQQVAPVAREGLDDAIYFTYSLHPAGGKIFRTPKLGNLGLAIDANKQFIYPSIYLHKVKGKYATTLQKIYRETYERAKKMNIREFRIDTQEDGGYMWAKTGFSFSDPLEREVVVKSARDWIDSPTVRRKVQGKTIHKPIQLSQTDIREMESMISRSRTPLDFAELSYKHPVHGKIDLGREWMTNTEWSGYVDISTNNPGHRLMKEWLYRGAKK